jgi:O-antigen/teichoic acid export membrane protein
MHLASKVAYNTIIQIISKIIAAVLGLIAVGLITRYLGQHGFGEYTTIFTFLSFFGIMADLGLTLVTVQMISKPGVDVNKIISNLFSLRLISAVVFLGLAPAIVIFFPYDPAIKIGVAIMAASFLFTALNQILVGVFQKNLRMDKVSIAEIIGRIVLVAGIFIAVKIDAGLKGIIIATVLSNVASFILHYIFSLKFVRVSLSFDMEIWKEIIRKSWPLALTIAFNLVYLKTDTLILSLFKTQAEVGIYGAAYKVIDVLITMPFMFAGIVLPIIASSWVEKNAERFKNVMQKSFDFMAILAMPIIAGTQFIGGGMMSFVAGEEFSASGPVLRILILAAGIIFVGITFTHGVIAIDKQKNVIGAYIFTGITAVAGYLIFIPKYSYFGAAWVTIYSELFIVLTSAYLVWKYSRFIPSFNVFVKSILASLIMGGGMYLMQTNYNLNLFLIILISIVIYFSALFMLRAISRREILEILGK